MKYFYSVFFLLLISFTAYSQTGIGTATPHHSAVLDVTATDKGVLIPRLALSSSTDTTTITKGNVNGLLVFNTQTIADVVPGFYYWFNSKWNKIIVGKEIGAENGVTIVDGKAELGGTLTKPTRIDASYTNRLQIAGLPGTIALDDARMVLTDPNGVLETTDVATFLNTKTTVSNTLTGPSLSTVVNGVTGTVDLTPALTAATTNTLETSLTDGSLISTVNGVSSSTRILFYTYNGVSRTPSGAVTLGGEISLPTVLNMVRGSTSDGTLSLQGLEETTSLSTDNMIVADPVTGVLKKTPTSSLFTSAWGLSGNAGSATSFLGTTNNFPLTFKANNGTKMTITPAGNIGIGTTTPNAPLEFAAVENLRKIVLYQHTVNNDFQFHGFGISTYMLRSNITNRLAGFGWFVGTSATSSSELMRLTGDGNLGIGIDAPAQKLHVAGKAIVTTMDTGDDTDQIVTVDAAGLLKKRPTADIAKTYTAGTGIDITGTVISANTSNTLEVGAANGNLTSTVNGVASAGIPVVNNADNGITRAANGTVQLGGTLTKPTEITTSATNSLTLSGLESATATSLNTDQMLLLDSAGEVKKSSIYTFLNTRTTFDMTSTVNNLSSSVNGKVDSVDIINSNELAATDGNLISTVNGIASNLVSVITTPANGLTRDRGRVILGGTLSGPTTITASATNKLEIASTTAGALKIADGTQAAGRVLTSAADGTAQWRNSPRSWTAILRKGETAATALPQVIQFTESKLIGTGGSADHTSNSIVVPHTGLYEFVIRAHNHAPRVVPSYIVNWTIRVNGARKIDAHYGTPHNTWGTLTSTTAYEELNAGDVVTLLLDNRYSASDSSDTARDVTFVVKALE